MTTAVAETLNQGSDTLLSRAPHRVGQVSLVVRDLDLVADFYRSRLGLQILERGRERALLGTDGSVLLALDRDPEAPVRGRRDAGLFHTAFLLPDRGALGAWLAFAMEEGIALTGAADHLVSEAVYLNDPEGNGIEIYADRPDDSWAKSDGLIEMASDPLDLGGLVRASRQDWSRFPDDGSIGHVHLQVGDLEKADAFYRDQLGFDITCFYSGANFYGSGGYHHQLAGNIWNSRGASVRPDRSTGLSEVELLVDEAMLEAVRRNARSDEQRPALSGELRLRDPWGTSIRLRTG